jgi:two-component system, OmpR family, phosphate regulon sensor histidine kinase PhoR
MSFAGWFRSPTRLAVLLLGGTALSAAAVLWMAIRFLEQDRTLEREQTKQRLEAAGMAAAALVDRALLRTAERMAEGDTIEAPGAVMVRWANGKLTVTPPDGLLYAPESVVQERVDDNGFASGERSEFEAGDWAAAAAVYRRLASDRDTDVRAGAMARLGRVQLKAGDRAGAMETYRRLAEMTTARFAGVPAPLVAHWAREDGAQLGKALDRPVLLPTRDTYLYYAERATELTGGRWQPDEERLAIAEAIHDAWAEGGEKNRRWVAGPGRQVTVLRVHRGDTVSILAAGVAFAEREWAAAADSLTEQVGLSILIDPAPGRASTILHPGTTGLPWAIGVRDPGPLVDGLFAGRRRVLAGAAGVLAAMLLLTGYLAWRAVSREMATVRMQADFVAAVSHEFRTPLTALRQFTTVLLERETLSAQQRQTCYEAQARSTERLSRLVESLLDFRRMEAGAGPCRLEPTDAGELARKVAGEFAAESGAAVRVESCGPAPVLADAGALSMALWNLLDNAVKYGPPGEPVELRAQTDGGSVDLTVRDRGPGIPLSEQRRIFDKFVRGSEARRLGIPGTGIGLAIVRHVAEAHRGRVELANHPEGGCVFKMILPKGK